MKKKLIFISILAVSISMFSGCAKNGNTEIESLVFADNGNEQAVDIKPASDNVAVQDITVQDYEAEPETEEFDPTIKDSPDTGDEETYYTGLAIASYDMDEYMELGTYEKMVLQDPGLEDVTMEDLESRISAMFKDYSVSTYPDKDASVEKDSIVEISYAMSPDINNHGEYTQIAQVSGTYLDKNISEALIGKKAGDSFETEIENIENHDIIKITGKIVSVRKRYPYTNETIAKVSNQKYQNEDAMVGHIFREMLLEAQKKRYESLAQRIAEVLANTSKVKEYPGNILEAYIASERKLQADRPDVTDEQIENVAKTRLFLDMIMVSILQKEGITISNSEYKAAETRIKEENNIETPDEWKQFVSLHGEDCVEKDTVYRKAVDAVLKKAIIL